MRTALFCFQPGQLQHLLEEHQPVLLVVPEALKPELHLADAADIPSLILYALDGWQRPLEQARPDRVLTLQAPPHLKAELQLSEYTLQELPEEARKAPG
jgi:hypothetical protein